MTSSRDKLWRAMLSRTSLFLNAWRHCWGGLDSDQGGDVSASLVVGVSSVDVFRACCRSVIRGRLNTLDVLRRFPRTLGLSG